MSEADDLRSSILGLVDRFSAANWTAKPFEPGVTPVPVAGRVFEGSDVRHAVDAALDFWLTTGRFAEDFESRLETYTGTRHAILVNSGSSANLLALSALTSPKLGARRLRPGDEVITCATGFPTTVNPILQNALVPVFVDVDLPTGNADPNRIEAAIGPKTRAIFLAHTLGNPFDLDAVRALADRHDLFVIEDCCDALGAEWNGRRVGSFGDLATLSFYPAHHITTGEGGAVLTSDGRLKTIVESLRDWGRDCWCEPGHDDTCHKRFGWKLGDLPEGYDHKYIYSHIGYNLKLTDLQAAIGVAQMEHLPEFVAARRRNHAAYTTLLGDLPDIVLPRALPSATPSWFGFTVLLDARSRLARRELVKRLEARRIGTRMLFGGNLIRQPAYAEAVYRVAGSLERSDAMMDRAFWVGVFPGLTPAMVDFVASEIRSGLDGTGAESASRP